LEVLCCWDGILWEYSTKLSCGRWVPYTMVVRGKGTHAILWQLSPRVQQCKITSIFSLRRQFCVNTVSLKLLLRSSITCCIAPWGWGNGSATTFFFVKIGIWRCLLDWFTVMSTNNMRLQLKFTDSGRRRCNGYTIHFLLFLLQWRKWKLKPILRDHTLLSCKPLVLIFFAGISSWSKHKIGVSLSQPSHKGTIKYWVSWRTLHETCLTINFQRHHIWAKKKTQFFFYVLPTRSICAGGWAPHKLNVFLAGYWRSRSVCKYLGDILKQKGTQRYRIQSFIGKRLLRPDLNTWFF
jgi:hypothetical protein